ncbi:MAG TPA: flavodoxin family protein [Methanomassiliicoccales archaeon]|jgi:flavodoxin
MKVEVYHASRFGNGERVADEIKRLLQARGNEVDVHHIKEVSPKDVPPADLYVFGSPTRFGKAPGGVVRFMKKIEPQPGARYAVFGTFGATIPDKKTGRMPSEEEMEKLRRTIPMLDEQLSGKGMVKVAEMKAFVNPETLKGPLEEGWQKRVEAFVAQILAAP